MLIKKKMTPYLSRDELAKVIQHLAAELNEHYDHQEVVLIGVLKGAILFFADLVRQLRFSTEIDFVRLSSYGKEQMSSGTVIMLKDIQVNIQNRHVLIIEELIDSGRTLKFLYDRLKAAGPLSLEIVTLLDKTSQRVVEVPVKYKGQSVDDQFLIGYGLDLEERCRNYPDIYYLH